MQISDVLRIALVGMGATFVLDAWIAILKRFGVKTLDVALIGRWTSHSLHGRFIHVAISTAHPMSHERTLGWLTHYAIGIGFAGLLFAVQGVEWFDRPTFAPAAIVGLCTVIAPLFVMQPAMGAGFAASKTPTPFRNCIRSAINHTVFGCGLYFSAVVAHWLAS
jgi:Protein of unknown function (DUF2938)